ncbi:MAG: hypothetical protein WD990_02565 [Acidimicrobiia bacterium]
MTTIKTTCNECGDVELAPDDLVLELDPTESEGNYRFACPECGDTQRRPANSRVVSVLLATGVSYEVIRLHPITEDEIESFVVNLSQETNPFRLLAN